MILFEPNEYADDSEGFDQDDLDEDECDDADSSGEDFFEEYVPKVFPPVNFNPNAKPNPDGSSGQKT